MALLTVFKSDSQTLMLMQNAWSRILNPVLANPITNMRVLKNVPLIAGTNVINHLLGQTQQGWVITDIQGASTIYRNAAFNDLTLSLHSSADVVVNIGVY